MKLLKHQIEPTRILKEFLCSSNPRLLGTVVVGQTGCGKTYVMAGAIKQAQEEGKLLPSEDKPFQLHTVFVLAPTNVVTKHRRVFSKEGIKNVEVITGDSLRASYGETLIDWIPGEGESKDPVWNKDSMPEVILVDECQQYKNPDSLRTRVLEAFIKQGGRVVFISATPFQKASEAKLISLACGLANTNREYKDYANLVSNYNPSGNSPTAVKKIQEDLRRRDAWINISNVRYPFKPVIKNQLFDLSPVKREVYNKAYLEYQIARQKAGKNPLSGIIEKWVAMQKFRQTSELLKVDDIVELAYKISREENRAVIFASNFIPTLREGWNVMVKKKGVGRHEISFLIGNQSQKERQKNIDDFQAGRTNFFFTTLKSGGTGLDLHHEVESSKPRSVILPPTWSCYEMVQVLGRAQRITNLSAVHQYVCWNRDTIEEEVASRLESKLDCLKELIDRKDSFMMDIFNKETDRDFNNRLETEVEEGEEGEKETQEESLFDLSLLDGEM